jgi:hypothetical protein
LPSESRTKRPDDLVVGAQQLLLARATRTRTGQHLGALEAIQPQLIGMRELGQVAAEQLLARALQQLAEGVVDLDQA